MKKWEELLVEFREYKGVFNKFEERVKVFVQNTSFPIEDRWNLFIETGVGIDEPYYINFSSNVGKHYVEELTDKYETHTVKEIAEDAENYTKEGIFYEDEEEPTYTQEDINEFKEEVLKLFIKSFIFDW